MKQSNVLMDDTLRLALILESVRYCQRVKGMGMPAAAYTKALREPIHFLWERRAGNKICVAKYRSRAALGMRFGNGDLIYDHAVPFCYLQEELLQLAAPNEEDVKSILNRHGTIVLITRAENARLNAAGYNRKMPSGKEWTYAFERYEALGIELVECAGGS